MHAISAPSLNKELFSPHPSLIVRTMKTLALILLWISLSIMLVSSQPANAVEQAIDQYLSRNVTALGCTDVCNVCNECYTVCGIIPGLDTSPISRCTNYNDITMLWNRTCSNQQAAASQLLSEDACYSQLAPGLPGETSEPTSVSFLVSGLCRYLTTAVFDVLATATSTSTTAVSSGPPCLSPLDDC
jgi:hypothetical protein